MWEKRIFVADALGDARGGGNIHAGMKQGFYLGRARDGLPKVIRGWGVCWALGFMWRCAGY